LVELVGRYSSRTEQMIRTRRCAALAKRAFPARSVPAPVVAHRVDVRLDEQTVQLLLAGYQAGASGHQLAKRYGLARSTVIELLRKHGVPVRYPRVTPAEAAEMVALYRTGVRQVDIAARFGRDPGIIWHVLKRPAAFAAPSSSGHSGSAAQGCRSV
jgi:hypothetical protein